MCPLRRLLILAFVLFAFALVQSGSQWQPRAFAGDTEFLGSLDGERVANTNDLDQIIFRPVKDISKIKTASPLPSDGAVTAGRLYDPLRDKSALLTLLVQPEDEQPYLYIDLNLDNNMTEDEKRELEREDRN